MAKKRKNRGSTSHRFWGGNDHNKRERSGSFRAGREGAKGLRAAGRAGQSYLRSGKRKGAAYRKRGGVLRRQ